MKYITFHLKAQHFYIPKLVLDPAVKIQYFEPEISSNKQNFTNWRQLPSNEKMSEDSPLSPLIHLTHS